jgi:hypothetical protein
MSMTLFDVEAFAAALRKVGAGKGTLDGLTLDLTVPPYVAPPKMEAEPPKAPEEIAADREAVLLGAAPGGRRARLPFGRTG